MGTKGIYYTITWTLWDCKNDFLLLPLMRALQRLLAALTGPGKCISLCYGVVVVIIINDNVYFTTRLCYFMSGPAIEDWYIVFPFVFLVYLRFQRSATCTPKPAALHLRHSLPPTRVLTSLNLGQGNERYYDDRRSLHTLTGSIWVCTVCQI